MSRWLAAVFRSVAEWVLSWLLPWIQLQPAWRELHPAGGKPLPRWQHRAVYDVASNQMAVFGGKSNDGGTTDKNFNDVWILTNADDTGGTPTWAQATPNGALPTARHMHSAVYDPSSKRMIVFGGHVETGGPFANDVWVLKHAVGSSGMPSWTELTPTGTAPSPREWHSAVYDMASNRMVVFGGTASSDNKVWLLEHANGLGGSPSWLMLAPAGPAPGPRIGHTAVYDAGSNRMIVFAGQLIPGAMTFTAEVWVLRHANGLGGSPDWTKLSPSGSGPAPRSDHTAVYDAAQNRMVIFGGWSSSAAGDTYFNDVWVLEHANGLGGVPKWTVLDPLSAPPEKRELHSAVYSPSSKRMTMFGGSLTPTSMRNDVWLLSRATGA